MKHLCSALLLVTLALAGCSSPHGPALQTARSCPPTRDLHVAARAYGEMSPRKKQYFEGMITRCLGIDVKTLASGELEEFDELLKDGYVDDDRRAARVVHKTPTTRTDVHPLYDRHIKETRDVIERDLKAGVSARRTWVREPTDPEASFGEKLLRSFLPGRVDIRMPFSGISTEYRRRRRE